MAQPVHCDFPDNHPGDDGPPLATQLRTDIETGDVTALCDLCQLLLAVAQVGATGATIIPPGDSPADDQDDEDQDDADAAAVARIEGVSAPQAPDPGTAVTVKRGTSQSRRAHQARTSSAARNQLPEPVLVPPGYVGTLSDLEGDDKPPAPGE
jgi:hypothetical protein